MLSPLALCLAKNYALLNVLLFSCQKNILHYVIAFGALLCKELCIMNCALCIMNYALVYGYQEDG